MNGATLLGDLVQKASVELAGELDLPVLSMTRSGGLVPQDGVFRKRVASRDHRRYKVVKPNQLVVGIHIDEGALGVSGSSLFGIVSPAYTIWELPKPQVLDPAYLHRYIRSPRAINYFKAHYRQTAERRGKISQEQFLALPVPLPPLAEQRRIIEILDVADALRDKRLESIAALDALLQSTFLDMFGDLSSNPKGWPEESFGVIARNSFRNGLSPSSRGVCKGSVLTLSAITRGKFCFEERKQALFDRDPSPAQTLNPNTFLICRGNGNKDLVGVGVFADRVCGEVCFPDTMVGVEPRADLVSREYLELLWRSRLVRRQIESGARTTNGTFKVNHMLLSAIRVLIPPIELQHEFGRVCQAVARQKARLQAHVDELEALFASLQSRAFNGEL